ncbi:MAG: hypothetical protein KKE73_00220 [Proteobacteria bacterium]|nr:hypothetical protein [Pseudomonadota bacterium]
MKFIMVAVCCMVLGLLASGCARGISQDNGRAQCLTWSPSPSTDDGGYFCLESNEICAANFPGQVLESLDRAQCEQHCAQVKRDQRRQHPVDGCEALINKAWDLCRTYCSSKPATQ